MKTFLKLLFLGILLTMIVVTVRASLAVSLRGAWHDFAANPWAVATLYDAYFGFLTFYCWLVWRERSWARRVIWAILIAATGNMAMATYVLIQLFRLRPEQSASTLFEVRS